MWSKFALLCILTSFVALSVGSALNESLTYDEVFYLEEGRRIVRTRAFSDPYNPPLAPVLTAIPMLLGWDRPIVARLVTVALGAFLILAVYQVGRWMLGRAGGLVAAAILAFDPTTLAHSHYVTNDIALTLFIFLATIAGKRYLARPRRLLTVLLGLAMGYALASKMTAIPFLLISFTAVWWWQQPRRGRLWMSKRWLSVLGSVIVALGVLWASYLFTWDVLIRQREDPGRVSRRLVAYAKVHNLPALASVVTFMTQQPLPLGTYGATVKNNLLRIRRPSIVFFDGAIYDRSRWYFMMVNVLRKTPIPLSVLVVIGVCGAFRMKIRQRRFVWMVLTSGAGIILVASFVGMVPLVRYVLPAMPFLALVAAAPTSPRLRGVK
ncbi:glycosyltransferase family 39 protein, partial [Candidatus Gottesmanbacteria bacterium]|nr:glycosyltransferase family 39 protein [Candidatus Gottesmanbacteria bacterium]